MFRSLEKQSFKDFIWAIADDCSEDNTKATVEGFNVPWVKYIRLAKRTNAGGARNAALAMTAGMSEYTLYVDADDFVPDQNALQKIHDFILESNYPDLVRLGAFYGRGSIRPKDKTMRHLIRGNVAPWLSCHKSKLSPRFVNCRRKWDDNLWYKRLVDKVSYFKCFPFKFVAHTLDSPVSSLHSPSVVKLPECKAAEYYYVADLLSEKFDKKEVQDYATAVANHIASKLINEIRSRNTTPEEELLSSLFQS